MSVISNVLLGIGNRARADDGVGVFISGLFRHPDWLSLDGGTSPENFTSRMRASGARTVVLVDAVRMGLAPGAVRRIPRERVQDTSIGTHDIPLSRLMDYIGISMGMRAVLIGIEPARLGPGEGMSPEVESAARSLVAALEDGSWRDIPEFEGSGAG